MEKLKSLHIWAKQLFVFRGKGRSHVAKSQSLTSDNGKLSQRTLSLPVERAAVHGQDRGEQVHGVRQETDDTIEFVGIWTIQTEYLDEIEKSWNQCSLEDGRRTSTTVSNGYYSTYAKDHSGINKAVSSDEKTIFTPRDSMTVTGNQFVNETVEPLSAALLLPLAEEMRAKGLNSNQIAHKEVPSFEAINNAIKGFNDDSWDSRSESFHNKHEDMMSPKAVFREGLLDTRLSDGLSICDSILNQHSDLREVGGFGQRYPSCEQSCRITFRPQVLSSQESAPVQRVTQLPVISELYNHSPGASDSCQEKRSFNISSDHQEFSNESEDFLVSPQHPLTKTTTRTKTPGSHNLEEKIKGDRLNLNNSNSNVSFGSPSGSSVSGYYSTNSSCSIDSSPVILRTKKTFGRKNTRSDNTRSLSSIQSPIAEQQHQSPFQNQSMPDGGQIMKHSLNISCEESLNPYQYKTYWNESPTAPARSGLAENATEATVDPRSGLLQPLRLNQRRNNRFEMGARRNKSNLDRTPEPILKRISSLQHFSSNSSTEVSQEETSCLRGLRRFPIWKQKKGYDVNPTGSTLRPDSMHEGSTWRPSDGILPNRVKGPGPPKLKNIFKNSRKLSINLPPEGEKAMPSNRPTSLQNSYFRAKRHSQSCNEIETFDNGSFLDDDSTPWPFQVSRNCKGPFDSSANVLGSSPESISHMKPYEEERKWALFNEFENDKASLESFNRIQNGRLYRPSICKISQSAGRRDFDSIFESEPDDFRDGGKSLGRVNFLESSNVPSLENEEVFFRERPNRPIALPESKLFGGRLAKRETNHSLTDLSTIRRTKAVSLKEDILTKRSIQKKHSLPLMKPQDSLDGVSNSFSMKTRSLKWFNSPKVDAKNTDKISERTPFDQIDELTRSLFTDLERCDEEEFVSIDFM